jgi:hypothetical protein
VHNQIYNLIWWIHINLANFLNKFLFNFLYDIMSISVNLTVFSLINTLILKKIAITFIQLMSNILQINRIKNYF